MKFYIICNGFYPFLAYQGKVSQWQITKILSHYIWFLETFQYLSPKNITKLMKLLGKVENMENDILKVTKITTQSSKFVSLRMRLYPHGQCNLGKCAGLQCTIWDTFVVECVACVILIKANNPTLLIMNSFMTSHNLKGEDIVGVHCLMVNVFLYWWGQHLPRLQI